MDNAASGVTAVAGIIVIVGVTPTIVGITAVFGITPVTGFAVAGVCDLCAVFASAVECRPSCCRLLLLLVSLESCIACILAVDCFSSGACTVADNSFFCQHSYWSWLPCYRCHVHFCWHHSI